MKTGLAILLFQSVKNLSGVGEKRYEAYKRLNIHSIRDLIYHMPVSIIDRRQEPPLNSVSSNQIISQVVKVDEILHSSRGLPTKIICSNATGAITLVYFNAKRDFLTTNFSIGKSIAISGKVERSHKRLNMVHPDIVTAAANLNMIKRIEPVYSLTYGLTSRYLGMTISNSLKSVMSLPEWLEEKTLQEYDWPKWKDALEIAHYQRQVDLTVYEKARARLAYDEILAQQICLQIARGKIKIPRKEPLVFKDELRDAFISSLPFPLTNSQKEVISEITADQRSENRMFRLLQGDVGSGKTVVAFAAMLNAVAAGKQAALMVPTEILARQHYKKLNQIADLMGIKSRLLISNIKNSEKDEIKAELLNGDVKLVVGTHALLQEKINFNNLGLVVIDEQHRFGVEQRLSLVDKGSDTDYLMMTATPIPRTLAMIGYGDIDISSIREKPNCRQEIITSIAKEEKLDEVIMGIERMIKSGNKIYWVCPLIANSEKMVLANAEARFKALSSKFPNQVGIIHGQMSPGERDANMQKFIDGELKILVATTVIEVGVDVPDATVIIIENAERFGLSQLHQLRGRVGRGDRRSYCILLAGKVISHVGYSRLMAMKRSDDGFELAEKDLEFRGGGDLLGTKQSGIPEFKICDVIKNQKLIPVARREAQQILESDPYLTSERGQRIKILLQLFEMDKGLSYLETYR